MGFVAPFPTIIYLCSPCIYCTVTQTVFMKVFKGMRQPHEKSMAVFCELKYKFIISSIFATDFPCIFSDQNGDEKGLYAPSDLNVII